MGRRCLEHHRSLRQRNRRTRTVREQATQRPAIRRLGRLRLPHQIRRPVGDHLTKYTRRGGCETDTPPSFTAQPLGMPAYTGVFSGFRCRNLGKFAPVLLHGCLLLGDCRHTTPPTAGRPNKIREHEPAAEVQPHEDPKFRLPK